MTKLILHDTKAVKDLEGGARWALHLNVNYSTHNDQGVD